jgi:hypothetical protein
MRGGRREKRFIARKRREAMGRRSSLRDRHTSLEKSEDGELKLAATVADASQEVKRKSKVGLLRSVP